MPAEGSFAFLEVDDLTAAELTAVLDAAERPGLPPVLEGKGAALLFEKPSNRTRSATEMAVVQLGGHPVTIRGEEVGFDSRETVEDIARTLACYHALLGARVFSHRTVERLAAASPVPVVNLLSDHAHPMQALADLLTLRQRWGSLPGRRLAWVGDFNNMARSLAIGATLSGIEVAVATPPGYGPPDDDVDRLEALGRRPDLSHTPAAAVDGADAVVTDIWASMGQEADAVTRHQAFSEAGFTVDAALMGAARADAVFLHCLPAHRGEEVAAEVVDGPASLVWTEAANRLHTARGLLWWVLEGRRG
jgi:ornithine carbamoyltransferase